MHKVLLTDRMICSLSIFRCILIYFRLGALPLSKWFMLLMLQNKLSWKLHYGIFDTSARKILDSSFLLCWRSIIKASRSCISSLILDV